MISTHTIPNHHQLELNKLKIKRACLKHPSKVDIVMWAQDILHKEIGLITMTDEPGNISSWTYINTKVLSKPDMLKYSKIMINRHNMDLVGSNDDIHFNVNSPI